MIFWKAINGLIGSNNDVIDLSLSLAPAALKQPKNAVVPSSSDEISLKLSLATTPHPRDVKNNFGRRPKSSQESLSGSASYHSHIQFPNQRFLPDLSLMAGSKTAPCDEKSPVGLCKKYTSGHLLATEKFASIPQEAIRGPYGESINTKELILWQPQQQFQDGILATSEDGYSGLKTKIKKMNYPLHNSQRVNLGKECFLTLNITSKNDKQKNGNLNHRIDENIKLKMQVEIDREMGETSIKFLHSNHQQRPFDIFDTPVFESNFSEYKNKQSQSKKLKMEKIHAKKICDKQLENKNLVTKDISDNLPVRSFEDFTNFGSTMV